MKQKLLYLHGFMGAPAQFDALRHLLAREICAEQQTVTLAGHGSDIHAFCRSNAAAWQKSVDNALLECADEGQKVLLIGHSMGGLLAISAALRHPDKVCGIAAIGLPLAVRVTGRFIHCRIAALRAAAPDEPAEIRAVREFCGVSGITLWNAFRLLPKVVELVKMIRRTNKHLPSLSTPLMVLNSARDEIVSPRSLSAATAYCPDAKTVQLTQSSHFRYTEEELQMIADAIKSML